MAELTKREKVRSIKALERLRLDRLRFDIKQAKAHKRERLRLVAAECRSNRERITARAKERRRELRDSIAEERVNARGTCGANRERVAEEIGAEVAGKLSTREREKRAAAYELANLSSQKRGSAGGRAAAVARSESDSAMLHEIEPRFRPVWAKVKHEIRARPNMSRAEVFAHWMHENSGRVAEILHAKEEADYHRLVLEERKLSKAMRDPSRYRGDAATLATHHDDWGG